MVIRHFFKMTPVQFHLQLLLKKYPFFLLLMRLVVQFSMQELGQALKDQHTPTEHQESDQGFEQGKGLDLSFIPHAAPPFLDDRP